MKFAIDTFALILLLAAFTAQLPITIAASYMIGAIFFLLESSKVSFRREYLNLYILTTLVFLPAALTFNHGFTPLFYLIVSPFLLYLANTFAENSLDHIQGVLRNVYWIFVFGIAGGLLLHWGEPEPLGAILPWASTNGIPSYLIVVQIAYSIAFYLGNNRLPLLTSLITLAVAIFGLGRGSIITAALILVFSIYINLFIVKSKKDRSIALKSALVTIIPIFVLLNNSAEQIGTELEVLIEGSKFADGILDEHRGKMLSDYLNKIDGVSLILGSDYDGTSINEDYGGNPHNSFIRIHSFYGLPALISIFLPLFFVLTSGRCFAQKIIVIFLILISLLRATTEPIFFPSTLDFFYFLYFALFFRFSRKKIKLSPEDVGDVKITNCKST